jgi:hypothetical protein
MTGKAALLLGIVFLIVGLGSGYLMVSHPQGLNPSWPLGMALLAPAAFTLGGLHMIAQGMGWSRVSVALLKAIAVCLLAIANWAAFFTARVPCVQTASFFGVPILQRYPSEAECRSSFQAIVVFVDAVVVLFFIALAWHYARSRRIKPL